MGATPLNTIAGRRRLSQIAAPLELPIVKVNIQAGSPDPEGLLSNATAAFAMGGSFDIDVLPRYNMKMTAPTEAATFGEAAVTPGSGSSSSGNASSGGVSGSSSSSSSSSGGVGGGGGGLSGGAIAGIVIGVLAGVAIVGILVWTFVIKKNKNLAHSQDNTSPAGSSTSGKFSTDKTEAHDDLA
jgi:hypothetical protein